MDNRWYIVVIILLVIMVNFVNCERGMFPGNNKTIKEYSGTADSNVVAKGAKTDMMMAELFGKETGYCKGKAGSIHIAAFDLNIVGANGIVGANIPIASGVALACKLRKPGTVTVCFFGDGATCTGAFHEGVNLAAIWNLPVIFVIENNLYAEKTRITDTTKVIDLSDRCASYGIPGISIDGNDVLKVYETSGEAINRARNGEGPTLIECKTYRWHGHFAGDAQGYKPKEEADAWRT